jgi:hypothetical protein
MVTAWHPHIANDRLATLMNIDMLDADVLPRAMTQATKNLYLHRIGL